MLTTKRYDYVPFDSIGEHPALANHRPINDRKVAHYAEDIQKNGLLEPLIVWERNHGEFFLVGGFHRMAALRVIRGKRPGYFDRVDVRVVTGELDEIQALVLKLNADRLDAKITDFFDTVILLNNANWSRERIADFLDRSVASIEEIVRYAPGMDARLRKLLEEGKVTWARAKSICRAILAAEPGKEKAVTEKALAALRREAKAGAPPRPLSYRTATRKLGEQIRKAPRASYTVAAEDLLSLLVLLRGKSFDETHIERVRRAFPGLLD
jgi:ParB-like chromosome segregation protein Spo0J